MVSTAVPYGMLIVAVTADSGDSDLNLSEWLVKRHIDMQNDVFKRLSLITPGTKWITEAEIFALNIAPKNAAAVLPQFKGKVFEHLEKLKCRIYGTEFVNKTILAGLSLPNVNFPSFSNVFGGIVVCFTGLPLSFREILTKYVQYMGGRVCRQLDFSVTHIVAEVCDSTSEKYNASRKLKLPVILPSWIEETWNACKEGFFVNIKSPEIIKKYLVPIFKGCVITISGFTTSERSNIGQLIELHGGVFSGEMSKNLCTHLITSSNFGIKFRKAVEWGTVEIVDLKWLKKCIEMEYRLPEDKFKRNDLNTSNIASNVNSTVVECETSSIAIESAPAIFSTKNLSECAMNTTESNLNEKSFTKNSILDKFKSREICQLPSDKEAKENKEETRETKKAISVFELVEKSAREIEKQETMSRSNSSILAEKRRRTSLVGNIRASTSVKNFGFTDSITLKLPVDIDMSQRDRNVMDWVDQCAKQSKEEVERSKSALSDATNFDKRKLPLKPRNVSSPLGEMVVNMHQDLLTSNYPLRATEFKKEILNVIEKFEILIYKDKSCK